MDNNNNVNTGTNGQEPNTNPAQGQQQTGAAQSANGGAANYDEIFAKLDNILSQRSGGIARSALKDNGLTDQEAREAVEAYKAQKAAKAKEAAEKESRLQAELDKLRGEIQAGKISAAVAAAAGEMGIGQTAIPYIQRLADLSGVVDDKGEPDAEKIKAAILRVVKDIPALKGATDPEAGTTQTGGFKLGANPDKQAGDDAQAKLRRAFGLK